MTQITGWFYPFPIEGLECMLPAEVLPLHETRLKALRQFLETHPCDSAIDLGCHQGYFTLEMEKYIPKVEGIDRFSKSIEQANIIYQQLGNGRSTFKQSLIEHHNTVVDLVLCYGVLYHVENPIQILRSINTMTQKFCIIETQVASPSSPHIEDGTHKSIRQPLGSFTLVSDYSDSNIGGPTNIALVPDLNAVLNLLKMFGFKTELYTPDSTDYEQFVRRQRVIIYAERQ
jgi:ubiquinone/menaquinone biosynthesis C-methylase UbiE